jgi:flagellar biosynthesis/type III secretory pathway chaperone
MEHLLEKLFGLLEHTTELYQSLFAVVQKEKDAVVGLNLQQLNAACKAKDNLLLKLRILEEQREQLMDRLAVILNWGPHEISLTQLSNLVKQPDADRLRTCSTKLLSLIQKLQEANQQNKMLLSHSLELVQGSYDLLNNVMAANPVYYRSGDLRKSKQTGKLLSGDV